MKKGIQIVLVSVSILMLTNCKYNAPSVEAEPVVIDTEASQREQDTRLLEGLELVYFADRINISNAMNAIAGLEGDVDWIVSYPDEYKNKPNLFVLEGTAKNTEKKEEVYLKLLVNRETGQFEVKKAIENGEELDKAQLMVILALSGAGWKSGNQGLY